MIHSPKSLETLKRRLRRKYLLRQQKLPINSFLSNFTEKTMTPSNGDKIIPIEDLMDANLDDLQDMPAFEVPPKGHYKLNVSLESKTVNDKPSIEAKLVVGEVLELANPNDKKPEIGAKFSQLFMMDNEFGQGAFKEFVKPIAAGLGLQNPKISQAFAAIQNVTIAATVKHRVHKEDTRLPVEEQRRYAQLTNVTVA